MNDQKNLILAIVLSVSIILFFQIFFPQTVVDVSVDNNDQNTL